MTDLLLAPFTSPDRIAEASVRQFEKNAEPELSVSLLLPKTWQKYQPYGPQPPDESGLIQFGRYGSPDGKALIELYAEPIVREIASADWFEHWARVSRYQVEKVVRRSSPEGDHVDALARRPGKSGKPFVYRMATFKDAGMVYLVVGFAHPGDFEVLQESFVIAIRSFTLTHGAETPSAEPLRTVELSRIAPVRFVVPQAWQRRTDPRPEVEVVHFENKGAKDNLLGQISVLVAPAATYPSAEAMASALRSLVTGPAEAIPLRPGSPSALGPLLRAPQQGEARYPHGGGMASIKVLVARRDAAWVGVARWSFPPGAEPFPVDAMNDRAYDIVLRTFAGA